MMELRSTGAVELRSEEERIITGTVIPWDSPAKIMNYVESFQRGAFADADPAQVPLLISHRHAELPVGRTVALSDREHGLDGEWRVSETRDGDELLALARDHVPLGISVGFSPIEDRWSPDRRRVTRLRAALAEVSIVGVPAYREAQVASVRSATPRLDAARLLGHARQEWR